MQENRGEGLPHINQKITKVGDNTFMHTQTHPDSDQLDNNHCHHLKVEEAGGALRQSSLINQSESLQRRINTSNWMNYSDHRDRNTH